MSGDGGLLWIFTKPAIPGRVKTRLVGELSAQEAASLHEAFLLDLVHRLRGFGFSVELAWSLDPGEVVPEGPLPGVAQEGVDLGEKLYRALCQGGERYPRVAVVGSDHPELDPKRVEEAFQELEQGADLVLGPAEDGGYYLVAARPESLRREVFQSIDWSTPRVLEQTLERAEKLELDVRLLRPGQDVDGPEDLVGLATRLRRDPGHCPRTSALLQSWGRLPGRVGTRVRTRGRCWQSSSLEETRDFGRRLAEELLPDGLLLLHGDLGAGKTVLAQGVAQGLGIEASQVQSPTFVLVREHQGKRAKLWHVDLYRLESSELPALGLEEILAEPGVKIVEWADRLDFPCPEALVLEIKRLPDGHRLVREVPQNS